MSGATRVGCERHHTTLRVPSLEDAVEFYVQVLGFVQTLEWGDPPSLAGVSLDEVQLFFEVGTARPDGCSLYFVVDDADLLWTELETRGATAQAPPEDRDYGLRDFTMVDPNGYRLTFGHRIGADADPTSGDPISVERAEITARLESRLAALLSELAEHKSMTTGELLEEVLLHSLEGPGADPHSARDRRRIAELRTKHGLDYPCHASYRFVERGGGATDPTG